MGRLFKKKDPLGGERYTGMVRGVATRERKRLRFLRNKWVLMSIAVLVLLGGIAGYALWYYYSLQGDVQIDVGSVDPPENAEEDPFTVLLVGSDSREGLTAEERKDLAAGNVDPATGEKITKERADTLILARLDPRTDHITMLQFPRDLYVSYPDGSKGKINGVLELGPNPLVQTVERLTGLDVNVYAQVNIAGFKDLIDAIDGVAVCIAEPIPFDSSTGIEVTADDVGMVEFDGERAVRFVRSRNFGEGDFARIQNQQKFLSAAINKVTSPRTFLSFGKLLGIKRALSGNLRIDSNTSLRELYDIMRRFRAFNPQNYEAYTVPNLGVAENEAGSVVLPDMPSLRAVFEAMAAGRSPADATNVPGRVNPSDIQVGVYNGVNHAKVVARPAARELRKATTLNGSSIEIVEEANAERANYRRTVIVYSRGEERTARFVAAAIPGAKLVRGDTGLGIDVEVIVGDDFRTRRVIRIVPIDLPVPGKLPEECR
jgi:LCP family protein required for cell wall assembly